MFRAKLLLGWVRLTNQGPAGPRVRIVEHDVGWAAICSAEVDAIRFAIAPARAYIDHVGSTAVPHLGSKPIIDLLVTLIDWNEADAVAAALEAQPTRWAGFDQ